MSLVPTIRLLKPTDVDAVVAIDGKITGTARPEYYAHKLEVANLREAHINASLVAEADGKVVGFLMATLFLGEFGIPEASALIDTVGVDPSCQDHGVGSALVEQFRSNMRVAGVERVYTLVDWTDLGLLKFFAHAGFTPSQRLNLELQVR
ncbi:MAG: GNAT family N-acetyltransferase [Deltaproteobacteria bacterium]|nr:GNAT family N-acetyltransferase [Deltaproteobacteria bacterium]